MSLPAPSVAAFLNSTAHTILDTVYPDGTAITKTTTLGPLVGRSYSGGVERYYGVSVAETTFGDNRFKPAIPLTSFPTNPFEAVEERQCMWGNGLFGSETCVSVDIVTKSTLSSAPVACWIHGGGFANIDYANPSTRGTTYYPDSGVVFCALHYRMSFLGWGYIAEAATETVTVPGVGQVTGFSGNYGATDIVVELQFMKANAAVFYGDADRINIFGESAGGAFVLSLMAMPVIGTLIKGAVMQSPFIAMGDGGFSCTSRQDQSVLFLGGASSFTGGDTSLAAMRGMSGGNATTGAGSPVGAGYAIEIAFYLGGMGFGDVAAFNAANAGGATGPTGYSPFGLASYAGFWFWPCADGILMPTPPGQAFASGVNGHVAVMVGQNSDELITFYKGNELAKTYSNPAGYPTDVVFPVNNDTADYNTDTYKIGDQYIITAMEMTTSSASFGDIYSKAIEQWGMTSVNTARDSLYSYITDPITSAIQKSTDSYLTATTSSVVQKMSTVPRSTNVYRYVFAQGGADWFAARKPGWGACHGCELTYVLGLYEFGLSYPMTGSYAGIANFNSAGANWAMEGFTSITYTAAETMVGTAMKSYWVNFFTTQDPNGAGVPTWSPATATDMNVMVFNEAYTAGAELNPCLRLTECTAEPAYNYKSAEAAFWKTGMAAAKPVCTTVPTNVPSLKVIPASTCPAYCPTRRNVLFGAPSAAKPPGCP